MRTYIVKNHGGFNYLRVVEPHKEGGWPHMHILVDKFICHNDVVKLVTQWGFGWNMHNVLMSSKNASWYLAGYLTKKWPDISADLLRVTSKCRIVSVSRGMPAIFTSKSEWAIVEYDCPAEHALFMCNAIIKLLKDKKASVILSTPFGDGFVIESDTLISSSWLEEYFDPYVWSYCQDFDYSYLPYGLQERLDL